VYTFCKGGSELNLEDIPTIEELNAVPSDDATLAEEEATGSLFSGSQLAILLGITDFLIEQAGDGARSWVLQDFADGLCKKEEESTNDFRTRSVLIHTCSVFAPDGETVSLLLGNGAMLRSALHEDLRALLKTFTKEALRIDGGSGDRDRRAAAHFLSIGISAVLDGTAPVIALRETGDPRSDFLNSSFGASWSKGEHTTDLPLTQGLFLSTQSLRAMPLNSETALTTPSNQKQLEYLLKAMAVNLWNDMSNFRDENKTLAKGLLKRLGDLEAQYKALETTFSKFEKASSSFADTVKRDEPSEVRLQSFSAFVYRSVGLVIELYGLSMRKPPPEAERMLFAIQNASRNITMGNYAAFGTNMIVVAEGLGITMETSLTRMIFLGGQLAMVQDAASAEKAIEAFAAPPGGWRRKRGRGKYVTINAYVGGVVGVERVSEESALLTGFHVPVGLEFGGQLAKSGSFGMFGQVLDVGSLASYRLKDSESVNPSPKAGLRQIFSPGVYFAFGLGRRPISLLVGGSYTPALRSLSSDDDGELDACRFSLSFMFDIPLLY
jgi:hypothetical protein